jgi:hypothetical protein
MSGREFFAAMVRVLGLVMTVYGVFTLIALLYVQLAFPELGTNPFSGPSLGAVFLILFGVWFLRGGDAVVKFAYKDF